MPLQKRVITPMRVVIAAVHDLEQGGSEAAETGARFGKRQPDGAFAVDYPLPTGDPRPVETRWVLEAEHGLGSPVTALLAQIATDAAATVMPHQRRRRIPDPPPRIEQPPADVHIITGHPELRVEPTELPQHRPIERHVAAGNV